jgi:hypothetical protein
MDVDECQGRRAQNRTEQYLFFFNNVVVNVSDAIAWQAADDGMEAR